MKKILMLLSLMLFNVSIGFAKEINLSSEDMPLTSISNGGKIILESELLIPTNSKKSSSFEISRIRSSRKNAGRCWYNLNEEKAFIRKIKDGTVLIVTSIDNHDEAGLVINFSPENNNYGITSIACTKYLNTSELNGTLSVKILVKDQNEELKEEKLKSSIKPIKSSNKNAESFINKFTELCVYKRLWNKKDEFSTLDKNGKTYLDTYFSILKKSMNVESLDCPVYSQEDLNETAINLSKSMNVDDQQRKAKKSRKTNNSKAKGHNSKNI